MITNNMSYSIKSLVNIITRPLYFIVILLVKLITIFSFHYLGQYLSLDTDHNGMLSKDELAR